MLFYQYYYLRFTFFYSHSFAYCFSSNRREEINSVIAALRRALSMLGLISKILKTRVAPMAMLTIPHISPITSLQKLLTLSAFFKSLTASIVHLIFLAAGTMVHAVTTCQISYNIFLIPLKYGSALHCSGTPS